MSGSHVPSRGASSACHAAAHVVASHYRRIDTFFCIFNVNMAMMAKSQLMQVSTQISQLLDTQQWLLLVHNTYSSSYPETKYMQQGNLLHMMEKGHNGGKRASSLAYIDKSWSNLAGRGVPLLAGYGCE